jgi:hypothetical protein
MFSLYLTLISARHSFAVTPDTNISHVKLQLIFESTDMFVVSSRLLPRHTETLIPYWHYSSLRGTDGRDRGKWQPGGCYCKQHGTFHCVRTQCAAIVVLHVTTARRTSGWVDQLQKLLGVRALPLNLKNGIYIYIRTTQTIIHQCACVACRAVLPKLFSTRLNF